MNKTEEIKNEEMVEEVVEETTDVDVVETEEKESKLKKAFVAVKNSKAGKIAAAVGIAALGVAAGVVLGKKSSDDGYYDYGVDNDNVIDVDASEVSETTVE